MRTSTSRSEKSDRVGHGLSLSVRKKLDPMPPRSLFSYTKRKQTGLYHASTLNKARITLYNKCAEIYLQNMQDDLVRGDSLSPTLIWSDGDVDHLVRSRSQINPPTFRAIANELNTFHRRTGGVHKPARDFAATDCCNKWHKLFPTSEDANMTVTFLKHLKSKWPGLLYYPKLDRGDRTGKPPVLTALHIIWPWSRFITSKLARSIFCDATYNVTVFNYRLVAITTLDGNKQHRPLMAVTSRLQCGGTISL